MKIFIKFLLITFIALIALLSCQNARQQTDTKDVLTIDSASVVINSSLVDSTSLDSAIIENITMPDSVKIEMGFSTVPVYDVVFSVNPNNENYLEFKMLYTKGLYIKEPLSKASSTKILRIIGEIFIDHKTPVIISKKKLPYCVIGDYPLIFFEIFYNGKTIKESFIVHQRQGEYEYTYSDSFLELFEFLYSTVEELYESHKSPLTYIP